MTAIDCINLWKTTISDTKSCQLVVDTRQLKSWKRGLSVRVRGGSSCKIYAVFHRIRQSSRIKGSSQFYQYHDSEIACYRNASLMNRSQVHLWRTYLKDLANRMWLGFVGGKYPCSENDSGAPRSRIEGWVSLKATIRLSCCSHASVAGPPLVSQIWSHTYFWRRKN